MTDQLNDIRGTLGAIHQQGKLGYENTAATLAMMENISATLESVVERLDAHEDLFIRTARFSEFLGEVETLSEGLPAALRSLAADPLGMMFAGPLVQLADRYDVFLSERRAKRTANAPAQPLSIEG